METKQYPITVVIAARNEAAHIEAAIRSVLASEGLDGEVDVIVADGNSTDNTAAIVKEIAAKDSRVRYFRNEAGFAPHAFNLGIYNARGRHVMIMGGHTVLSPTHLQACVKALDAGEGDIVGVMTETVPGGSDAEALAVHAVMTHPLGFGPSHFRQGVKKPTVVDTVAFGAMRGTLFDEVGVFDEDLVRGQDDEFNARVRAKGGKILMLPNITCQYSARTKVTQLFRMCFQYGAFKPVSNVRAGGLISLRQFVPSAMVLAVLFGMLGAFLWMPLAAIPLVIAAAYLLLSYQVASKLGKPVASHFLHVLKGFIAAHVGYGIGFLVGVFGLRHGSDAGKRLSNSAIMTRLSR